MTTQQTPDLDSDLRLVVVMRHGEAQASSDTGDEGRELTARGRADAEAAGRRLVEEGVRADVAIVSSATRTRQTWEAMAGGGLEAGDVWIDRALYNGEVADLVEAVRAAPEQARVVVLVGHSPSVPDLASEVEAHCERPSTWPPATFGVMSHPGQWSDFPGDGTALVTWGEGRAS